MCELLALQGSVLRSFHKEWQSEFGLTYVLFALRNIAGNDSSLSHHPCEATTTMLLIKQFFECKKLTSFKLFI